MPNVKNVIDGHNKKIRDESKKNKEQESQEKTCNCRKPADCPLNGQCLTKPVIYQATVTTEDDGSKETNIGLTKNVFKERFNGHKTTFRHSNKRNNTELSKYVWKLKEQERPYNIKWAIIHRAKAYDNKSKRCQLCTLEKYYIICRPELGTLNKRNELASGCMHKAAYQYKNLKL